MQTRLPGRATDRKREWEAEAEPKSECMGWGGSKEDKYKEVQSSQSSLMAFKMVCKRMWLGSLEKAHLLFSSNMLENESTKV